MNDHVCDQKAVLKRAFDVADATEWHGDMTVNFMIAIRSASVLAAEVRRLQKEGNNDQTN